MARKKSIFCGFFFGALTGFATKNRDLIGHANENGDLIGLVAECGDLIGQKIKKQILFKIVAVFAPDLNFGPYPNLNSNFNPNPNPYQFGYCYFIVKMETNFQKLKSFLSISMRRAFPL